MRRDQQLLEHLFHRPCAGEYHLYTRQGDVKEEVAYTTGDRVGRLRAHRLDHLHAARIPAMHGSCSEIYRERYFETHGFTPRHAGRGSVDDEGRLPHARALSETSLTFLVHHTIDEAAMRHYARAAAACLERA